MKKALVVGAGFAGATVARTLAESGDWEVHVIDARDHVAGNAYDFVNEHGIRVHKYGPHLWHTSNDEVQEWASCFTEWIPYQHKVRALLSKGSNVPLPINPETIEVVFGTRFVVWCDENGYLADSTETPSFKVGAHAAFLETLVSKHPEVTNARQHVENSVGKELCDIFFAPYTKKMWGLDLDELPVSVAARIPTNVESGSDLYFPKDKYQCLPKDGYTTMVNNILDHPKIQVTLQLSRERLMEICDTLKLNPYDHVFTSEPIDVYFKCSLGKLPWRSVKMHTSSVPQPQALPSAVLNFTHSGPHTRCTEWKQLPGHGDNPYMTTITFEEPCDYTDNNNERYYPVKTSQADCPNRALYQKYADMAEKIDNVTFVGRCANYQYYDMWMVIAQARKCATEFLKRGNNA